MSRDSTLPVWRLPMGVQLRAASRRILPPLAVALLMLWLLSHYIAIGPNRTGSLPISGYPIILVLKDGEVPARGGLVGFRPGPNRFYPADSLFVKRLAGLPGDRVDYMDSTFYVNGVPVTTTKPQSKDGRILEPGPTGVLPACRYFLATDHPDGYDSRYDDIGWVGCSKIVGRAYALP